MFLILNCISALHENARSLTLKLNPFVTQIPFNHRELHDLNLHPIARRNRQRGSLPGCGLSRSGESMLLVPKRRRSAGQVGAATWRGSAEPPFERPPPRHVRSPRATTRACVNRLPAGPSNPAEEASVARGRVPVA